MFTMRCTKRLLARMKMAPVSAPRPPTTRLGDWFATLFYVGREQWILCVSERTLLPVLLAARDARSVPARLMEAVGTELRAIGVSPDAVAAELGEMSEVSIDRTNNRQVLGSMNDFVDIAWHHLAAGDSLAQTSLQLSEAPCGPIGMESPRRLTGALFASRML